jgi:phage tail-like protein
VDVNGTRHHLLLGRDDWLGLPGELRISAEAAPPEPDLEWDAACAGLRLRDLLFRFPTSPADRQPRIGDRRGAGRDRYGNWYWIDADETSVRFLAAETRGARHFWSSLDPTDCPPEADPGDFSPAPPERATAPLHLRGLAVTEHHYLVVGVLRPAGLLIFDLHAGGGPTQVLWPAAVPFRPFDMAPAPGGGVWILDRAIASDDAEPPRLWALDRFFRVVGDEQVALPVALPPRDDFTPAEAHDDAGEAPAGRSFPAGIVPELGSILDQVDPLAIEALPDGTVLLLELGEAVVHRFRFATHLGSSPPLRTLLEPLLEPGLSLGDRLRGHDMAFVPAQAEPGAVGGVLYVVTADGNSALALDFADGPGGSFVLTLRSEYLPMRLFTGRALVATGGEAHYDRGERWVPLVRQPRPRYVTGGLLETRIFDGRLPDCVWHRLVIDARMPSGTGVLVESRAAEAPELLAQADWRVEPALYLRGQSGPERTSELPYHRPFSPAELAREGTGSWELLFQEARGRYLQLRLTLRGTGRATPRLHALRAYYPRFSYLERYLPAAYRTDPPSASFLDRFLANLEGLLTTIEGRIERVQTRFDVRTVEGEYLEWLAGWLGVMLDPDWDDERRRLFLAHAVELFGQRGTPAGLARAVRLAVDPCPDEGLFDDSALACDIGASGCVQGARPAGGGVRIVEAFRTRSRSGVVYGDATAAATIVATPAGAPWAPEHGAAPLHRRYRDFLRGRYQNAAGAPPINALNEAWDANLASFEAVHLPPVRPASAGAAADWLAFIAGPIGFTYAPAEAGDLGDYQLFLARRYRRVAALNAAYGLGGAVALASFRAVALPGAGDFPESGPRLRDWVQFVGQALPIRDRAHRFTVLVPTDIEADPVAQARLLERARQVAELEKPAHTRVEVRQYWALLRAGEARLGLDTVLGVGSRYVALVLGQGHLSGGYLAARHPWDIADRAVAGRDTPGQGLRL